MDSLVKKYIDHFSSLLNVECNVFEVATKDFEYNKNSFCAACTVNCDYHNTHLYGCFEAQRWDNKYIYYCPAGLIFIAVTILNEVDVIDYGVIAGPINMVNNDELDSNRKSYTTKNVNDISEIMSVVFANISDIKNKHDFATTDILLNDIYKVLEVDVPSGNAYPITLEKELQQAIIDCNKELSKEILNKLLGHIFFSSNSDLKIIKSRVLELVVLLSRSAIEGGADIKHIFALNDNYIKEVESFNTLEKLSIWITRVINRFISYVFEFNDVKHTDIIYKVTGYIKANYTEKISLDDVANYVYLSKSYLSKIFKEEMKFNLTAYINQVRIDKSKPLLLDHTLSIVDIANAVGFDDQSYYTKVFKSVTGVSPGRFREKHGKILDILGNSR